ncbi:hypothetical protein PGQ11_010129 [Apiospora arundinis]|uniref:Uncharacterized protein n=1 Tax=Apiospora arundinis TaxID=335852 RepID=A0ABR2IAI5_9PEZI
MSGITATNRLEDLGELSRQRPETQEATWRLLGALSFLSPVHTIPPTVFQSSPSSIATTTDQSLLPWLVAVTPTSPPPPPTEADTENDSDDDSSIGEDSDNDSSVGVNSDDDTDDEDIRPHASPSRKNDDCSVPGIKNLFEEAIQPLLETGIVRRAHVRGPITHIDPDTQTLYRGLTVRRHGQRDFDLAVRMLLSQVSASPSSASTSSSSSSVSRSSSPSSSGMNQDTLMHHVLALAEHHEHYARWNNDDDVIKPPPPMFSFISSSTAAETETEAETKGKDMLFAQCRFESTPDLELLTRRTLELAGYQAHQVHEMAHR